MKEEVMKVLSLLETGVINSQEAERLIRVISGKPAKTAPKAPDNITEAFTKVGDGLGTFAKAVGERAEKMANDARPIIEKVGKRKGEAVEELAERAKNLNLCKKTDEGESPAEECPEDEIDDENDFVKDDSVIITPAAKPFTSTEEPKAEEEKKEEPEKTEEEAKEAPENEQ